MADTAVSLLDLDETRLTERLAAIGQPAFRARQLRRHLFAGELDYARMDDLPRALRDELAATLPATPLTVTHRIDSRDGLTRKLLLRSSRGTSIETVLMVYPGRGDAAPRRTVCVSTQAGCALACSFCATGRLGLERNLDVAEIAAQVLHAASLVTDTERRAGDRPITNIVFMGMGEPFANYDRMRGAITVLTDPTAFGLGDRNITVSTAGLVPGIERFSREAWQVGLAVSLHAPNDALRSRLMPINDRYPLEELLAACRAYTAATHRRLTFEYVLIAGVNDGDAEARQLAGLLRGMLCHVNLIPMNPIGDGDLHRSRQDRVRAFRDLVAAGGIACTIRQERGVEIYGACGQLHRHQAATAEAVTTG